MSADVNQLQSFFYPFANQLVTGPAMLIASIVLLWCGIQRAGGAGGRRRYVMSISCRSPWAR